MQNRNTMENAVPDGFIRLSDVYKLPQTVCDELYLKDEDWFPELQGVIEMCDTELVKQAGRLRFKELFHTDHDYTRYSVVYTLWLDGKPFAIVQRGGRSGRDVRRRIVTDRALLCAAFAHVMECMRVDTDHENGDFYAEDYVMATEEVFDFYSSGMAKSFGFAVQPTRRDLFDYGGCGREEHLRPILAVDEILIVAKGVDAAEHLRSGNSYYGLVRAVTADDCEKVKRLDDYITALGEDAPHSDGRAPAGYVYRLLAERPANFSAAIPL